MRIVILLTALTTSVVAFLVVFGIGLFLAGVEETGERQTGLLMVIAAVPAVAAALALVFAPPRYFRGRKVFAALAVLIAIVPVVAIAVAALVFSGIPLGSPLPLVDWTAFVVGLLFAAGALSIVGLGYFRVTERRERAIPPASEGTSSFRSLMQAELGEESSDPRR